MIESERRFRMLFDRSPDCIHEIDREGRLRLMNRAGFEYRTGHGRDFLSSFVPITEPCGNVVKLMGITRDITDYNMPAASGLDVAAELFVVRPGIPVLLNSGDLSDELRARAHSPGIREVLRKPIGLAQLNAAIQRQFPVP